MNIVFDKDVKIPVNPQKSVLELALENNVNLANLCKGNARCSTCRIVVLEGDLPPRNDVEQKLADKLNFPDYIRLSCQLPAESEMLVRPVIGDEIDRKLLKQSNSTEEKKLAVLFSDIRSFTTFSERHLPYDIVHILNRYFLSMGDAIHEYHGRIDKYMGDGIMAIFGLDGDENPAVLAYKSALQMQENLKEFNQYLKDKFNEEFSIGIGIHYGTLVVGNLGHPDAVSYTAIGDTVNIAARVESATKGLSSLLVSEEVYYALDIDDWNSIEMELKGKTLPLRLYGPEI
jgi:adenylate cyclase